MAPALCSTARRGAPIRIGAPSLTTMRPRSRRSTSVRLHCWRNCAPVGNGQVRPASSVARSAHAATATRQATWTADEAEAYHQAQIAAFVEGGADMVTAYTLNSINEAIGIARAARAQRHSGGDLVHRGNQWPAGEGRNLARGDRDRGSRDRQRARIFPDQLRPSHAFRGCLEGG